MDKHERELAILERIVSEKKQGAKFGMIFVMIITFLFAVTVLPAIAHSIGIKLVLLIFLPLIALMIAALILNYTLTDRQIKKMEEALGIKTDEEFELILKTAEE